MSTALDALRPMLMCDDVQASIRFYTEVLGFRVLDRMDDVGKSGWAHLGQGPVQLMLASPDFLPAGVKVGGRFPQVAFYFYPQDVVALRAAVVASGHPASALVVRFYGMQEFEVVDPSGHLLVFGQPTDAPPPASPHTA